MASVRPAMLMPGWPGRWSSFAGAEANLVELDWYPNEHRIEIRKVVAGDIAVDLTDA